MFQGLQKAAHTTTIYTRQKFVHELHPAEAYLVRSNPSLPVKRATLLARCVPLLIVSLGAKPSPPILTPHGTLTYLVLRNAIIKITVDAPSFVVLRLRPGGYGGIAASVVDASVVGLVFLEETETTLTIGGT